MVCKFLWSYYQTIYLMSKSVLVGILIFLTSISRASVPDTLDFWIVKVNGKIVANSNEVGIMYGHPMTVNISSYYDTDTLQVFYYTDHGAEHYEWNLLLKDSANMILDSLINDPINTSVANRETWRKNYISLTIGNLKKLFNYQPEKVFIHFARKLLFNGKQYSKTALLLIIEQNV